jgi:Uma2 family endonuclease
VSVVCGKLERVSDASRTVTNPTLLVEVLSTSAEAYDRGKKFEHYRSIPTLKEYVLVSFREPLVESHTRNADGSWTARFAGAGSRLALSSVDAVLDVDELYRGMVRLDGVMHLP